MLITNNLQDLTDKRNMKRFKINYIIVTKIPGRTGLNEITLSAKNIEEARKKMHELTNCFEYKGKSIAIKIRDIEEEIKSI